MCLGRIIAWLRYHLGLTDSKEAQCPASITYVSGSSRTLPSEDDVYDDPRDIAQPGEW